MQTEFLFHGRPLSSRPFSARSSCLPFSPTAQSRYSRPPSESRHGCHRLRCQLGAADPPSVHSSRDLYLLPRTTALGAILITGFLGGAICTHFRLGGGRAAATRLPGTRRREERRAVSPQRAGAEAAAVDGTLIRFRVRLGSVHSRGKRPWPSHFMISSSAFLQTLRAVEGFLDKGLAHCKEKTRSQRDRRGAALFPTCCRSASRCCRRSPLGRRARGAKAGFAPPGAVDRDYAGLQKLVTRRRASLEQLKPRGGQRARRQGLCSRPRPKCRSRPKASRMTFSLPNFHFHATTAYDILRHKGVPLGKRDYMGRMKLAK